MATLPSQNLQSGQLLCFSSLNSPKFQSQIPPLKFPISSPIRIKPPKLCSGNDGSINSRFLGRASASASQFSADIAEALRDVSIFTAAGEPVFFKDLWDQNQESLLLHFYAILDALVGKILELGAPTSSVWELALELREAKARFDSAGVKLIAIGVGTPNKARMLAERLPFPMDCLYADPDRKAYDVLGLYFGFGRTFFNPASTKVFSRSRFEALQKAVKNYTIKATPEDRSGVLQQGGMFVFRGKELLYARKDEGTGDHAPLDDIFDICCKVPAA